jgi:DtxR family transcriptional regulator, Mn-dependent transcriptional regulator
METDEQILEYLFYLDKAIRPAKLGKILHIKHSTLNSALSRLQQKTQVLWEKYGSVELTDEGRNIAGHISNHHFIIEKFLKEILEMDQETAHSEALKLAPNASCIFIQSICDKLHLSHETINKDLCL